MHKTTILAALTAIFFAATMGRGETDNAKPSKAKKVKIGKIEWFLDYDEAMKVAKEKMRPLWLHFGEHPG